MVSSVVLRPERAAYLESQVAASYADYLEGRGEALGEWHGKAAHLLGLGEDVLPGDLAALIDGHNPRTAERLVRRPKPRAYEIDAFDPETGVVAKTQRVAHPVGGFDFTFSAPKSLSLAHALAEPAVARQVRAAHDAAVRAALTMLEDEACFTRLGASGAAKARGVGIAAALFAHRTSRAEDPQLHTHCAIINLTRPVDEERWRTLDSATLLRRWKLTLGYAYQAHLRAEITTRLGWHFAPVHKGMAELAQLDPELLRAFSQRRAQIEHHAETHGTSHQALQLAALETGTAARIGDRG